MIGRGSFVQEADGTYIPVENVAAGLHLAGALSKAEVEVVRVMSRSVPVARWKAFNKSFLHPVVLPASSIQDNLPIFETILSPKQEVLRASNSTIAPIIDCSSAIDVFSTISTLDNFGASVEYFAIFTDGAHFVNVGGIAVRTYDIKAIQGGRANLYLVKE